MRTLLALLVAASLSLAAGLPKTSLHGDYVEARTADVYTGPCFANSEVNLTGNTAVFGWRVQKGAWQGVTLDGLGVIGVVRANATLGDVHNSAYPVKSVLIVDEKANAEQRLALKGFAQRMGGDLLQDIVRVEYQPVNLEFAGGDMHSMKAVLSAGTLARVETRAIKDGDHLCSNEQIWYSPLTKLNHSMPAYAIANTYSGKGLDTVWTSPDKRSAFIGSFDYQD